MALSILLALSVAAGPPPMSTATYLALADRLRARGMAAVLSPDFATLSRAVGDAGRVLKAERQTALAAGRKPAYCPTGATELSAEDVYRSALAVTPPLRRATSLRDALRAGLARKYPCR